MVTGSWASALGMTALLTLAREPRGADLLEIARAHGGHRGHSDDGEDDSDPPVPDVRCDHDRERSQVRFASAIRPDA